MNSTPDCCWSWHLTATSEANTSRFAFILPIANPCADIQYVSNNKQQHFYGERFILNNIQFMQAFICAVVNCQCLVGLSQEKSCSTQELMFFTYPVTRASVRHTSLTDRCRNTSVSAWIWKQGTWQLPYDYRLNHFKCQTFPGSQFCRNIFLLSEWKNLSDGVKDITRQWNHPLKLILFSRQTKISQKAIQWIAMKFCSDIRSPQRMNPTDFVDPLTFHLQQLHQQADIYGSEGNVLTPVQ